MSDDEETTEETNQDTDIIVGSEIEDQFKESTDLREVPANELDMNMLLADPAWQNLKPNLRAKLMKQIGEKIEETIGEDKKILSTKVTKFWNDMSGILAVYTRDFRLGNISTGNGEYEYVVHHLRLAVEYLTEGYQEAFLLSLNKSLSYLETSSSKKGFLRKLLQTIRYVNADGEETEPEKKSPLANKKVN